MHRIRYSILNIQLLTSNFVHMKLIIGLGNPGKEYEKTRHNAGFMAVDKIISSYGLPQLSFEAKFNALISQGTIENVKYTFAKPQTFMNNSGKSAKAIMEYYKIKPDEILVVHDELDVSTGEYKISKDRSSAGHKGVQSIIDYLGTKDFRRIRIGIGVENKKVPTENFVLENFSKEEIEKLENIFTEISDKLIKTISS